VVQVFDLDGGPGTASGVLAGGVVPLRPHEHAFEAMLTGWRNQQLARRLGFDTVAARERVVRAFCAHAGEYPWAWTAQHLDEWMSDLRAVRGLRASTLRGYQDAVRLFCQYSTDPAYEWPQACWDRFGSHPIQVAHEWNTIVHVQDAESDPTRRAFTREELQAFFDHADDEVTAIRDRGRKGWLPAFRDATLFKVAYAYGLRRNEIRMLDVTDFGPNPHASEFAGLGVCYVRHGKASKGSPPKRRSVLTVWPWTVEVLTEWTHELLPTWNARRTGPSTRPGEGGGPLWPTERGERITLAPINHRFAAYRDALGLAPGLDFHSLRRSYVTHLIEDGWDPLFVQQQVGHQYASTTAIYTCVSSDFRTRTLRAALDATIATALQPQPATGTEAPTATAPLGAAAGTGDRNLDRSADDRVRTR
jgi:integrase/recombinase XerC